VNHKRTLVEAGQVAQAVATSAIVQAGRRPFGGVEVPRLGLAVTATVIAASTSRVQLGRVSATAATRLLGIAMGKRKRGVFSAVLASATVASGAET